jgi:predicted NUDIX family NTP pyrophosphohydrolase
VHPGGPFWARKDLGSWSIPKGEFPVGEDALEAAKREFREETGISPEGNFVSLGAIRQPSGKTIYAWAFEGDCNSADIRSNTFTLEWPRGSGIQKEFPEIDRGEWFTVSDGGERIVKGQRSFLDQLTGLLNDSHRDGPDDARQSGTLQSHRKPEPKQLYLFTGD